MVDLPKEVRVSGFAAKAGVRLGLYRYERDGAIPVLLLHGASAGRGTFLRGEDRSLAAFLYRNGYEPWLLDWRGSKNVVDDHLRSGTDLDKVLLRNQFDFDGAAEYDIPAAINEIQKKYTDGPIGAVGFCMGAGTLAQSIAMGCLESQPLTHIVLMTLGLYYKTPAEGRLKAEDFLLERLWSDSDDSTLCIDPRQDPTGIPAPVWGETDLGKMYERWPIKPHDESAKPPPSPRARHTCNRVSFMYGEPYQEAALDAEIHESETELQDQFGAIPTRMFLHASQNVRRGWAARYGLSDQNTDLLGEQARERFMRFKRITLITGGLNRLWHRDSVDRMHEWLLRGTVADRNQIQEHTIQKHIFPNNGHQDLLWGTNSVEEIFPKIKDALP